MPDEPYPYMDTVRRAIDEEAAAWRERLAQGALQLMARPPGDPSYFDSTAIPSESPRISMPATACPWDAGVATDEHGLQTFRFTHAGALRPAGLPTNMFDFSGNLFSTAVDDGLVYVQLHCMTDGSEVTSCEITTSSSPSPPLGVRENVAPSEFWLDLHLVVGGSVIKVVECANLSAIPVVALITEKDDPVCGGDPHVRHYTWQVSGLLES